MRLAALAVGAMLLAGARDDPLAGRTAGKAVTCINLPQNVGPEIVDARTILYRESSRRVWRTRPVDACPALAPLRTLIVDVQGRQLCRDDRFRVVTPGRSVAPGWCRFDRFVPYDRF